MSDDLIRRLRAFDSHPESAAQMAADRITALEAQLLETCKREAETQYRHDERVSTLEAQIAAADRLAEAVQAGDDLVRRAGVGTGIYAPLSAALAAYRQSKEPRG